MHPAPDLPPIVCSALPVGSPSMAKSSQELTPPITPPIVAIGNGIGHVDPLAVAQAVAQLPQAEEPLVAVIGCGYVGEHLISSFSKHYNVLGYDLSQARLEVLRQTYNQKDSRITFTQDPGDLSKATHFLISVPTLLLEDKTIDISYIQSALGTVATFGRKGSTVVVESSVAVGMTRQLLGPLVDKKGFFVGMSPERVDPGRTEPSTHKIPKIVSGLDDVAPGSLEAIVRLYSSVFDTIIPVSKPEVAEMMKLYENCQRMMCIAFANEMADACIPFGVDPYEVCRAASTKPFGYMPYMPSLGVGGHCIPVNPYYLLSNSDFPLLKACTEKMWQRPVEMGQRALRLLFGPDNEGTYPLSTVKRTDSGVDMSHDEMVADGALAKCGVGLTGGLMSLPETMSGATTFKPRARVLVVGMGFKAGQSVLSNSPGQKLAQFLAESGRVDVMFADPLVKQEAIPLIPRLPDEFWKKDTLEGFDMIIVAVKQHGLDLSVLQILQDVNVAIWCP
ncbi:hypothetical protein PFICI_12983 [Pestalotiopsis fici W106-1]|uniref:UDP-glucose/GDP-mannose dehydrogenase C-terminal domain-containing protein n=1 Tax=Pestalotiopsis fici (strain W106-1 / CGMCC3.15140) TaxID=1229662 RepID=W3WQF6_PESFW|nr:uncharacterized protein PFICI_12983 [Pestalotiopsis fici W106-1]ETS76039.1 hypothetical protein PFICI_12983 [Pestalotiopsis fici W106-1]